MSALTIDARTFADTLRALLLAASTDETRPHLSCVRFEVRACELRGVATDGHWMLIVDRPVNAADMPSDGAGSVTHVSIADAERILKALPKRGGIAVDFTARTIADATGLTIGAWRDSLGGSCFPPYRQVIPASIPDASAPRDPAHLSTTILAEVVGAFQALAGKGASVGIRVDFGQGPLDPCVVCADIIGLDAIAVVMPMRAHAFETNGRLARFRREDSTARAEVDHAAE